MKDIKDLCVKISNHAKKHLSVCKRIQYGFYFISHLAFVFNYQPVKCSGRGGGHKKSVYDEMRCSALLNKKIHSPGNGFPSKSRSCCHGALWEHLLILMTKKRRRKKGAETKSATNEGTCWLPENDTADFCFVFLFALSLLTINITDNKLFFPPF